ncbi:type II secretion system minor pseudopilin GspJ [Cellvibrio sp. QJXJ]|uniref:type II secretion system minor pseudopilin GspJ n=1 Tax=Cellvibrio sp. QJXJ TaxID=2964606 RepID=UPI0021C25D59|nr:type II secretion system minor pseudopilin GspJ [Cellvibrio sp. QJXJ]UUA71303.1 type II secretion system minor pseudopilin GspJ [Cellvibrio sp. QJXJ]
MILKLCSKHRPLAQRGFTLLEVMIALVISALIAVMAFQSLDAADKGAQRTNEVLDEINRLDRAWQIIAADLRHVQMPLANDQNALFQGESLRSSGENADQPVLFFKRRGWVNFANLPRSDLQLISYRVVEGKLWRDFMPEYNRALADIEMEDDAFHQLLLNDVDDLQLRFLHQGIITSKGKSALEGREYADDWLQQWPDSSLQGAGGLPLAVEITIDIKGVGPSVRLFALPEQ